MITDEKRIIEALRKVAQVLCNCIDDDELEKELAELEKQNESSSKQL